MSVTNVHELRSAILDHGMKLEEINFDIPFLKKDPKPEIESSPDQQKVEESPVFNHEQQASLLLALLPDTQEGKMPYVRKGLLYSAGKSVRTG